jgi:NTP pyrophosphatase (non-canonical NTP hydrolase)
MDMLEFIRAANKNAREKGFWDADGAIEWLPHHLQTAFSNALKTQKLMLIVTELSEAVEALREGNDDNFIEEIADVWIRLADFSGEFFGQRIIEEIKRKMEINAGRPAKHGKAF